MTEENEQLTHKQLKTIFVGDEALPTYFVNNVIRPFYVELTSAEDGYIATSSISNAFELGDTADQALKNYLEFLVDEVVWLQNNAEQLSPALHEDLHRLQGYIRIV